MAIRQSRGRWCVEFQQRGERIFRRLPPGITKAQAQDYETKLRRGIFDGEQLGKKPDITLTDAIGRWLLENQRKNQRKAKSEAKQWESFVKGKMLRQAPEVAQAAVIAWQNVADGPHGAPLTDARSGRPTAVATINRRLAMLKAVCKHSFKRSLIGENLSPKISMLPEHNKRDIYLTKPEALTLTGETPIPAHGAGLMLLSYSGLRVSELLAQEGLTEKSDTFYVPQDISKNRKPRYVPIAPPARPYLRSWLAQEQFPSYWQLHKAFLVARRKAKLPYKGLRIHDLRHTAASWLINAGVDIYTLSKILGHSSIQTTQRYAHLYRSTLKDAMGRLE